MGMKNDKHKGKSGFETLAAGAGEPPRPPKRTGLSMEDGSRDWTQPLKGLDSLRRAIRKNLRWLLTGRG